jgi:hypothetical protein
VKPDIRFIAHAHIVVESHLAFEAGFSDQGKGDVAALGKQGDGALGHILQPYQIEAFGHADHPEVFGPMMRMPFALATSTISSSKRFPSAPSSPKAPGDHHSSRSTFFSTILQDLFQGMGRGGDQGQVNLFRDVQHRPVTLQAENSLFLRVNGIDAAFVFFIQQDFNGLVAPLCFIFEAPIMATDSALNILSRLIISPLLYRISF